MSVACDGNAVEVRIMLGLNPSFALCYSTFGGLNTPLHFAIARGHVDLCVISSRCLFVIYVFPFDLIMNFGLPCRMSRYC
jgi:hypothetical protein